MTLVYCLRYMTSANYAVVNLQYLQVVRGEGAFVVLGILSIHRTQVDGASDLISVFGEVSDGGLLVYQVWLFINKKDVVAIWTKAKCAPSVRGLSSIPDANVFRLQGQVGLSAKIHGPAYAIVFIDKATCIHMSMTDGTKASFEP